MKKTKLIQFDLELAKQGAKLVYKNSLGDTHSAIYLESISHLMCCAIKGHIWETKMFYSKTGQSCNGSFECVLIEVEVKTQKVWVAIRKNTNCPVSYLTSYSYKNKEDIPKDYNINDYTFHEIEREI